MDTQFTDGSTNVEVTKGTPSPENRLMAVKTQRWILEVLAPSEETMNRVLELRRQVYVNEWRIMNEHELISPNDSKGVHVILTDLESGELAGCTHMIEAEESDFGSYSGISEKNLEETVLSSRSTVAKEYRKKGVFQLLGYTACQWYRQQGRKYVVAYLQVGDHPTHTRFKMQPIPGAEDHIVGIINGDNVKLSPYASSIEYIMHRGTKDVSPDLMELIALLVPKEIEQTVYKMASKINESALWRRAEAGTLTQIQYAEFLAQLHHFVRYTTRVVASALSNSDDKTLRAHFRKHMNEETDHELIIESDLKNLGVDVEYYTKEKVPHPGILNFNGLQESLLSHRKNPILYMAVPFAVEGISAFISSENMANLHTVARSWGFENPKEVTAFLASHISFDGGVGGHWEMTLDMIKKFISTEHQAKEFLMISKATIDNILSMIESTVSQNDWTLWHRSANSPVTETLH